jgi:hypothetical protein
VKDGTACKGGLCSNGKCADPCAGKTCDDGNACTTDGCDSSTGNCTTSNVDDGTMCDTGVCLGGNCSVPNYVSDVYPILQTFCSGCHGGPLGNCSGGTCLAECYAEATKTINCRFDTAQTNTHDCLTSYVTSGEMPFGSGCAPGNRHAGCPTDLDVNIITAWNNAGAPATSDPNVSAPVCQ